MDTKILLLGLERPVQPRDSQLHKNLSSKLRRGIVDINIQSGQTKNVKKSKDCLIYLNPLGIAFSCLLKRQEPSPLSGGKNKIGPKGLDSLL